jgi:hypothetical protein
MGEYYGLPLDDELKSTGEVLDRRESFLYKPKYQTKKEEPDCNEVCLSCDAHPSCFKLKKQLPILE